MNESERVEREKEIIDKIIQKLPPCGNYYVEHNKTENSFIVRRSKKQTTNTDNHSVIQLLSQEG